jgi:hypothetical protein
MHGARHIDGTVSTKVAHAAQNNFYLIVVLVRAELDAPQCRGNTKLFPLKPGNPILPRAFDGHLSSLALIVPEFGIPRYWTLVLLPGAVPRLHLQGHLLQ